MLESVRFPRRTLLFGVSNFINYIDLSVK